MDGYGHIWTEERVKNEIIKCMSALNINRMPTANELRTLGRNDLHIKISRTRKYSGWAKYLELERKTSETTTGQLYEEFVEEKLKKLGHSVVRMTTKYPYDLLVDGAVKVDVKFARPYNMKGSIVHAFGISKKNPTCDIYIVLAANDNGEIEREFVIPSHYLKVVTLCIGKDSKYNKFLDRWGFIKLYSNFYSKVSPSLIEKAGDIWT